MCELCTGVENCTKKIFKSRDGELMTGKELEAQLSEAWSNNSARGYVVKAMENKGFKESDIKKVIGELRHIFSEMTLKDADEHYCRSKY